MNDFLKIPVAQKTVIDIKKNVLILFKNYNMMFLLLGFLVLDKAGEVSSQTTSPVSGNEIFSPISLKLSSPGIKIPHLTYPFN